MCGIAGYWGEGSREVLERMGRSLAHRGPDAEGYFEYGPVGLAHRRLSIIDLSPTGAQPMSSRDGSNTIVFNGEIYNHKELRERFLEGYHLKGTSDTEVLLALYDKLGSACFEHLRGMFAFALYDAKRDVLILVRDQLGKKPLYWSKTNDTFLFGSELKALRAHPRCPTDLNRDAIAHYLVHEYVPRASAIYSGVAKLLPGTYLTYDGTDVTINTYSSHTSALGTYRGTREDAENELRTLLTRAVSKRLVADVPVGIFLSGGLDSSTIAYLAQQGSKDAVKTFSIGFEDAHFDESSYAKDVATSLGTEHYERTVTETDLLSVVDKIPQILDEPIGDSSIIPTYLLSEFARTKVTVALGGDGADELFWGYDTFFAHRLAQWCEMLPLFAQKSLRSGVQALPVSHEYMSLDFKLKKFVSGFDVPKEERNAHWLSAFTTSELERFVTFPITEGSIFSDARSRYAQSAFWDALQNEYLEGYLTEDILVKAD